MRHRTSAARDEIRKAAQRDIRIPTGATPDLAKRRHSGRILRITRSGADPGSQTIHAESPV